MSDLLMKKRIVIITTGWFPEGDAGAVRLRMMGKILVECGYHVVVLCRGELNSHGTIDGIEFISLRSRAGGKLPKLMDYLQFPQKVKNYLHKYSSELYGIYLYNAHDTLFKYCKKYCSKNNIKLYHDCVEWYSPEEYKWGRFDRWYRMKDRINRKIIDGEFRVIAITKYLQDYFSAKGIQTIRVPILCNCEIRKKPKELSSRDRVTIFYGGLPGTKDLVGNLLEGVLLLSEDERDKIRIVIVGATSEYLVKVSGVSESTIRKCDGILELCGRVSRNEVLEKMEEADFAFLARDASLRYAKAGFPSKVVEALSNATPILCNITSDLADYLTDGYNSIICDTHKPEDIAKAIKRIIVLSSEERRNMSVNALYSAKQYFDYRNYLNVVSDFFEV